MLSDCWYRTCTYQSCMKMTYLVLCYPVVYLDLFGLEADLFVRPLQPPLPMDRSTIIFWWAQHSLTRAYRVLPWVPVPSKI